MSIIWNGVDLETLGFTLVGEGQMESGLLSLPALVRQETVIPGRVSPDVTIQRRSVRDVRLDCALFADDHATLLANRDAFVNLVGGGDYGAITVPDRAGLRLMAATVEALDIPRPDMAWETLWVRFTWTLRARIPYWEDAEAALTTAPTNYCTSPGFETDSNSDGLADGWDLYDNVTGSPTLTLVAGRIGGNAQRIQYTGDGSGNQIQVYFTTADGTFAPGDPVTIHGYFKVAITGCTARWEIQSGGTAEFIDLANCAEWTPFTAYGTVVSQTFIYAVLNFVNVSAGDTIDVTMDDIRIEKPSVATVVVAEEVNHFKAFPTAVLCSDGTILCAYKDGISAQDGNDAQGGNIYLVRWTAGTWGAPVLLYPKVSDTNQQQAATLATRASDGRIFLYSRRNDSENPAAGGTCYMAYSDDDGANWTARTVMEVPAGLATLDNFGETANKFVELPGGILLMTCGGLKNVGDTYYSRACVESADGITWAVRGWIAEGNVDHAGGSYNEANMIRVGDGRLLCVLRIDPGLNPMEYAYSSDDGVTWTAPASFGPAFGHAPAMFLAPDNTLFLTFRGSIPGGTWGICLLRSLDHGTTWQPQEAVAPFSLAGGYCDMVLDASDDLHAIYYGDDASYDPWIQERILPPSANFTNLGDEPCPMTWTCTVTANLPTGLWFEVGGLRFTYTGALVTNDVLIVETELPTVKKNGVANWSDVSTAALFPWLAVGANVVTKSSADFTLKAGYRRWWR